MTLAKSRWDKLREETVRERQANAHSVSELTTSVTRRLKTLGTKGHCSPNAIGWIQAPKGAGNTKIGLRPSADGRTAWDHPAVRLRGLEHLEDGALLTMSIEVDGRKSTILAYSVSIEGSPRALPEQGWHARIDLTEAPAGQGLCGEPLLHCHVGGYPGRNDKFSPRVPLPWLHPADALDWLLATVDPALEPHME